MTIEFSFDYILYPKDKLRPVIPISFTYLNNSISLFTLIDSGSDINLSFKEVGEGMGMIFSGEATRPIDGATGSAKGWVKPIEVEFCGEKFSIEVIWADMKFEPDADFPMIFGRSPLFDNFNVEFKNNSKIIFRKS